MIILAGKFTAESVGRMCTKSIKKFLTEIQENANNRPVINSSQ